MRVRRADQHGLQLHLHLRGRLVAAVGIGIERALADRVQARGQAAVQRQRRQRSPGRQVADDLHLGLACATCVAPPASPTASRPPRTDPRADRPSRSCSCSGAMYASFPLIAPGRVWCDAASVFATPKSTSLTCPSYVTNTFCGLTSRCTTSSARSVEIGQRVRVLEAGEHAGQDPEPQRQAQLAAPAQQPIEDAVQRLAVEVLHRDRELPVAGQHLVGLHDVRVIQPERQPRLVEEHRDEVRLRDQLGPDPLQDLQPANPAARVHHGEQHFGHAPAPDLRDRFVAPAARARDPGRRFRRQHARRCSTAS